MRVAPLEQNIGLGAHHEERRAEREAIKALEVDVARGPSRRRRRPRERSRQGC
jgi:hypothetical protein